MKELNGILTGTNKIIDDRLSNFQHGIVGMNLKSSPPSFSAKELLEKLIIEIETNLRNAIDVGTSSENWREKRPTQIHDTRKPERNFEHQLANAGVSDKKWTWWNQMPIASGLVFHRADRTRAIDLVCKGKTDPSHYRFIELKCDRRAGTPLVALMEIIRYGLVYLVLRKNLERSLDKNVTQTVPKIFGARLIELCVLAPGKYYGGYKLKWLETSLTSALEDIIREQHEGKLTMTLCSYSPTDLNDYSNFDENELGSYITNWVPAYS
jgi:hypothetical protein